MSLFFTVADRVSVQVCHLVLLTRLYLLFSPTPLFLPQFNRIRQIILRCFLRYEPELYLPTHSRLTHLVVLLF